MPGYGSTFGDSGSIQVNRPDPSYSLASLAPSGRDMSAPAVKRLRVGDYLAVRGDAPFERTWLETLTETQATPAGFQRYMIVSIVPCKHAPLVFVQPSEEPLNESPSDSTTSDTVPPSRFRRTRRTKD